MQPVNVILENVYESLHLSHIIQSPVDKLPTS